MASNTLTVTLPSPLAENVRAAAEARGLSPEDYVRQQLELDIATDIGPEGDLDWEEDLRRLEEPGEDIDAETVFAEFRAKIEEERRAKK